MNFFPISKSANDEAGLGIPGSKNDLDYESGSKNCDLIRDSSRFGSSFSKMFRGK